MGIWTGIKHALNSTLGTADFQPLNEMIADVKSTVIGQRTLAASDSVIKVVNSSAVAGSFTPQVNGSVRVIVYFTNESASDVNVRIRILRQGEYYTEASIVVSGKSTRQKHSFDINVSADYTYSVDYEGTYGLNGKGLSVGANIVDTSLIS